MPRDRALAASIGRRSDLDRKEVMYFHKSTSEYYLNCLALGRKEALRLAKKRADAEVKVRMETRAQQEGSHDGRGYQGRRAPGAPASSRC